VVQFRVDNVPYTVVASTDGQFGPSQWEMPSLHFDFTYRADVTSLVTQGAHTFEVTGVDGFAYDLYGAALVVMYETSGWPVAIPPPDLAQAPFPPCSPLTLRRYLARPP